MQGNLTILLIFCHIIHITLSLSDSVIDHNSAEMEPKEANLNRRKLPIFPKNTKKFVATSRLPLNIMYSHKPKQKIMPKMSLTPQITLKPELETSGTKLARRKPLMKLRTFTIKSLANGKSDETQNGSQSIAHVFNKPGARIGINTRTNPIIKREDIVTEAYVPEKSPSSDKNLLRASDPDEKAQPNEQDKSKSEHIENKFSFEEKQDRNEFIFLENENKDFVVDMPDNSSQEFNDGAETTTEFEITEKAHRLKRSNNIIEEENMASTLSGMKYTGRDTRLNNNVYFKNINS